MLIAPGFVQRKTIDSFRRRFYPRTKVEQEGDKPISNVVALLYHAVKHYREEHPELQTVPIWVEEAERMLALVQGK